MYIRMKEGFAPTYPTDDAEKMPIAIQERKLLVAFPGKQTNTMYQSFYKSLYQYLNKLPTSLAKYTVNVLLKRKLIYVGRDVSRSTKTGVIGSWMNQKNRVAGIILDVIEVGIDPDTGEIYDHNVAIYTVYYEMIRAATTLNFLTSIRNNDRLHIYMVKYLYYLMLRIFGSNRMLNQDDKLLLHIICRYFYYRFSLGNVHSISFEEALSIVNDDDYRKVLSRRMTNLDSYSKFRDIFKSIVDVGLSNENLNMIIMSAITKFKPAVFNSITGSIDRQIAIAIISQYNCNLYNSGHVSSDLQSKIENIIIDLIRKVKFSDSPFTDIKLDE